MLTGLVGERGTGKTQIAAELGRVAFGRAAALDPYQPAAYAGEGWEARYKADQRIREEVKWAARWINALDLFATMKMRNLEAGEGAAIAAWSRPGLLVIDEAQERGDTEFEQRMLTNLIDKRYGMLKDTLIISNLSPDAFGTAMGPSIMSRMQQCGGMMVCDWPSYRAVPTTEQKEG